MNDPQASEKLTEFIVCQILRMIGNKGGNKNGDALVEAYRGRYPVRRMYAWTIKWFAKLIAYF